MDLGAMEADRDKLLDQLRRLRDELAAEADNVPYSTGDLDALIAQYEAMLAKRLAECRRLEKANARLENDISKLIAELERLKEAVRAARLALANQMVLYFKALENIQNADDRALAEDAELQDALAALKALVKDKVGAIKDISDELQELRKMEMDIAEMRAEIEEYRRLVDMLPDPTAKGKGGSPSPAARQPAKRRKTDSGAVKVATPSVKRTPKPKAAKSTAKKSTTKRKAQVAHDVDMDLNDDGRTTRSEARAYRSTHKSSPKKAKVTLEDFSSDVVIEDDLINDEGYTLLSNLSDEDVDLSGWKIKARIGHTQQKFPKGTMIPAGGNLHIYAKNVDIEEDNSMVWKTREQTTNDDSDVLELHDAAGKVVQRFSRA